jgi:hypothetical protein
MIYLRNIKKQKLIVDSINKEINFLLMEESLSQEKIKKFSGDINKIKKDVDYLNSLVNNQSRTKKGGFPYNYCEITFNETYEIELPKYGIEKFDRKLKGRMYFKVVGGDESKKFIDLRTDSFSDKFKLRIYYQTLVLFNKQKGKAHLIYDSGSHHLKGDEETIYFEINKLN